MAYHAVQALRRYQRHRQRMEEIQKYYESCLNPVLLPSSDSARLIFPATGCDTLSPIFRSLESHHAL